MSNVINLADRKKVKAAEQEVRAEQKDIKEKIRENLKKLPGYRGEVITKNNIRQLPDVKVNEIFWVQSDNYGVIVTKVDGKKIELKALDETATVSTGMTIYEMNKTIISKEPLLNKGDEVIMAPLVGAMKQWFNDANKVIDYLAYGRDCHYVTVFRRMAEELGDREIKIVLDTIEKVGDIISVDVEDDRIEVWIRTKDSAAELIYIFPYEDGVVLL